MSRPMTSHDLSIPVLNMIQLPFELPSLYMMPGQVVVS